MLALFGVHLQGLVERLLAPVVTLGTIAGGGAIIGALVGDVEAHAKRLSAAAGAAHVQARYNAGLVLGAWAALVPVILLLLEVLT